MLKKLGLAAALALGGCGEEVEAPRTTEFYGVVCSEDRGTVEDAVSAAKNLVENCKNGPKKDLYCETKVETNPPEMNVFDLSHETGGWCFSNKQNNSFCEVSSYCVDFPFTDGQSFKVETGDLAQF